MSELGDMLRSARLKRNLSLADVSRATRIKESFLAALEDGTYHLLPGPAYAVGFLRNYATFLGLHPDDMVQDYYSVVPAPQPTVKAASRILASGHERYHRTRLLWGLAVLVLLLACGYTIKQYNEIYAHPYSAPLLTPANLGAGPVAPAAHRRAAPVWFRVQLRATAPVWVRVTADNRQVFQGILRPRAGVRGWLARRALYLMTFEGARLRVTYDGRHLGQVASQAGPVVDLATPAGLTRVS